jgi:hypothetical protein
MVDENNFIDMEMEISPISIEEFYWHELEINKSENKKHK